MSDSSENDAPPCLQNNKPRYGAEEDRCVWWIDSPKHNYCLWTFIKERSAPDGSMDEMGQAELAKILSWSFTRTHFTLKEAMIELRDALNASNAKHLLDDDPDQIIDLVTFDLEPKKFPSED